MLQGRGQNLLIVWKGVPKYIQHTNRRSGIRGRIASGLEVHIWAIRHTQKKWPVGNGNPYICFVSAINGRVKNGNCKC
jgi:hypothetical protein